MTPQASAQSADEPSVTTKLLSATLLLSILALPACASAVVADALPDANVSGTGLDLPVASLSAGDLNLTIAKATLPGFTIRRTVPEVRLQFTVADDQGHPPKAITSDDLQIFDNRIAVPRIRDLARVDDLPLEAGILLDVSDSVEKNAQRERQAAQMFIARIFRPLTDRVSLMAFSNEVRLWQRATGNADALQQALVKVPQRGSITYLYDGVYHACMDQFAPSQAGDPAQRILVLISDGEDTGSLHTLADATSAAQRREVQIYAVSIHSARLPAPGDKVLKQLAESTGGQLYVVTSEKDFPALFASMEQQLRTQYAVSFQPADQTPGFHTLRVQLAGDPKIRVRSRSGYFYGTE